MLYRHGAFGRSDPEEELKIRREILFRYPNMDTMAERPTSKVTATNCVITRTPTNIQNYKWTSSQAVFVGSSLNRQSPRISHSKDLSQEMAMASGSPAYRRL